MKKFYLVLVFAVFLNASSLSEIIILAQSSSLAKISSLNPQKANLQKESVRSSYMPSLSLDGGYQYVSSGRSVLTPKHGSEILAKIELLLYDGGKREASLSALKHIETSEILKDEDFKNRLALDVCKLYFNYIALDEIIKAKESEIEYLKNAISRLEKFYIAGLAATDELEAIRAKFHIAQVERLDFIQKRNEIKNNVNLIVDKALNPKIGSKIDEPSMDSVSNNLNIKSLEYDFKAATEEIRIAGSNSLPKIFIKDTLTYYKNDFSNDFSAIKAYTSSVNINDFFKEKGSKNEVTLGFTWKIFDFGAVSKDKQIKEIAARQAALNLERKKLENELNLQNLKNEMNILKEKISSRKTALRAANSAYEAVLQKYEAGLTGYVEFLQALLVKFEAVSGLEMSKDEYEIKKAEFLYENGEDILKRVIDE